MYLFLNQMKKKTLGLAKAKTTLANCAANDFSQDNHLMVSFVKALYFVGTSSCFVKVDFCKKNHLRALICALYTCVCLDRVIYTLCHWFMYHWAA